MSPFLIAAGAFAGFKLVSLSPPGATLMVFVALLCSLGCFVVAKWQLLRAGHFSTFGPGRVPTSLRPVYWAGWALLVLGLSVAKQDANWWIGWVEEVPGVNCQESRARNS